MKTLKVKKSYERFEVEVGEEVIGCRIDCTDGSVNRLAARCIAASDRAQELAGKKADLSDPAALDGLSREMAGLIGPVIVDAIGRESYDAILTACGDGARLEPAQANLVMVQVFSIVCQAVVERVAAVKDSKAAHYLQGVLDAPQPDSLQ